MSHSCVIWCYLTSNDDSPKRSGTKLLVVGFIIIILVFGGFLTFITMAHNGSLSKYESSLKQSSPSSPVVSSSNPSTQVVQNTPYSLQVTKIVGQQEPTTGGVNYYLTIELADNSGGSWQIWPDGFVLGSSSSTAYNPISMNVQMITLSSGENTQGQLEFTLPQSQTPVRLTYNDLGVTVETNYIPQVSWATTINSVQIQVAGLVQYNWGVFGGASGIIENPSYTYTGGQMIGNPSTAMYTGGQTITVLLSFVNNSPTPQSLTLNSIVTSTSGFVITSIQPTLPIQIFVGGQAASVNGEAALVTLTVVVPSNFVGNLSIVANMQAN
jgi:hypothetical protein